MLKAKFVFEKYFLTSQCQSCLFANTNLTLLPTLYCYDRSQFRAPPMPACRYMEDNGSCAMLATKMSAGVTPEMNLMEHITCTPRHE